MRLHRASLISRMRGKHSRCSRGKKLIRFHQKTFNLSAAAPRNSSQSTPSLPCMVTNIFLINDPFLSQRSRWFPPGKALTAESKSLKNICFKPRNQTRSCWRANLSIKKNLMQKYQTFRTETLTRKTNQFHLTCKSKPKLRTRLSLYKPALKSFLAVRILSGTRTCRKVPKIQAQIKRVQKEFLMRTFQTVVQKVYDKSLCCNFLRWKTTILVSKKAYRKFTIASECWTCSSQRQCDRKYTKQKNMIREENLA